MRSHPYVRRSRLCTRQNSHRFLTVALATILFNSAAGLAFGTNLTADLYADAGIQGGVVVRLGVDDGRNLTDLCPGSSYLVQGLTTDPGKVDAVREMLDVKSNAAAVTVRDFDGHNLPFIDNLVNVIVIARRFDVADDEILRVLTPGGLAVFLDGDGKSVSRRLTKKQPAEADDWTHYLHDVDNNAVSNDTRIDSIDRLQWVGGPRWSRHHDHIAGLTAMVSTGGRVFYVMDEGKTFSILLPSRHFLIARDAYNGMVLWKKPLPSWHPHLWPLKSGPAQLPRRLVARGDRVYVPLGMAEPLSVLDAATGEVLKTFSETRAAEEVLVADGTVYVLANPRPEMFEDFTLGDAHNGTQKARVAKDYPWNKSVKTVFAIDDATGVIRWKRQAVVAPLSLTVGQKHVLFFNGSQIVALNKATGAEAWRSDNVSAKRVFPINEAPTLVAHGDYVLFAGDDGHMTALASDTGKTVWTEQHLRGGYCSPQDLFVINDLVWSGAIASPRSTGIFAGRDVRTGEEKRDIPPMKVPYTFGHHRCHRAKATSRFILSSKTGIEFYDIANQNERVNHWVRGGCLYGIMPANGLIYSPMNSCACHLDSKLTGFNALAPKTTQKTTRTQSSRFVKGPAFSKKAVSNASADWPTFRSDMARSGFSPHPVADRLKPAWQAALTGKLSSITVGDGKVFVASVDRHCLYALDQKTGDVVWTFRTAGRIDSPPSLYGGFAYFGCGDGHVYSVATSNGQLAWRFRLAPDDTQLCAYGQLESVWPVNGSVLIQDGKVFTVGGRSCYLDSGLIFVRLDALTGALEAETVLDDIDPRTGKSLQLLSAHSIMPSAIPDILSSDGENLFMRVEKLSRDGERLGTIEFDPEHQYDERHIFSWAGFLEDSWLHRIYMSYGNGKIPLGTYLNWWEYGEANPDGRLLVMDDARVYSYGLKPKYHTWSSTFLDYQLFSVNKQIETEPITGPTIFGRRTGRTPQRKLRYNWTAESPFYVRAMIKAADKLVLCGPEDVVDEKSVISRYPDASFSEQLQRQDEILDGKNGCVLWVVSATDGKRLEELRLPSLPVWDGMAAADGRVYLATQQGVVCLDEQ